MWPLNSYTVRRNSAHRLALSVQDFRHPRLLVADDSVTVQKVIELTFLDSPMVVELVGDGSSARDAIAAHAPDMVIADVHMPGLSGYDIAAFAKSLDPSLPVLLLVGAFEPFDEAAFQSCQADAALEKPFDSQELYEAVTTLLRGEGLTPPLRFSDRRIVKGPLGRITVHEPPPRLAVFLCHATQDKEEVRSLAQRLRKSGFDPWLDEERLLPGQQWELEITRALRASNAILVCLSQRAVSKTGYVQKEVGFALDLLSHQPEGSIYLIPLQLEPCELPVRLAHLQAGQLYAPCGYVKLLEALNTRAESLRLPRGNA